MGKALATERGAEPGPEDFTKESGVVGFGLGKFRGLLRSGSALPSKETLGVVEPSVNPKIQRLNPAAYQKRQG